MPEDPNVNQTSNPNPVQPGQVVNPGGTVLPASPPQPTQPPSIPLAETQAVSSPTPQQTTTVEQPSEPSAPEPIQTPMYSAQEEPMEQPKNDDQDVVSWTASEYVAHDKDFAWYAGLAIAAAVLAVLLYLITRDLVSSGVAIFGAFLLGFYGARKPRQLTYELDNQGLKIGEKNFRYTDFKKFALVPEGAASSIRFVPHKRFGPPITIFYGLEDEDRIVNILASHLPIEEHRIDFTDRLMRRIRF